MAGDQEVPQGASSSCGVIVISHEPCQSSGWPIWGTLEEVVGICRRSTAVAFGECRETFWANEGKQMEHVTYEYGIQQLFQTESNADWSN